MYNFIKPLHSFLPYLILAILVISILVFLVKRSGKKPFAKSDKMLALITLILVHTQLTVGLILYFISPITQQAFSSGQIMSNSTFRFYAVEHILVMIIATVLITIGYSRSKKITESSPKFLKLIIFYTLGLILILTRIPWFAWPS